MQASENLHNSGLAHKGMQLNGQGFVIERALASRWKDKYGALAAQVIKPYLIGRDLVQVSRDRFVVDLYPLGEEEVRKRMPEVYQLILEKVKPERIFNRDPFRREKWWWFGRTHDGQRDAVAGLTQVIATPRQSKHRFFVLCEPETILESTIVLISLADFFSLGVLSSRVHTAFSIRVGGWLGVGNDPRYLHNWCFDRFPYPVCGDKLALKIRAVAEELDAHRKARQAEHPKLTLTQMYNVLEKLRAKGVRPSGLRDSHILPLSHKGGSCDDIA